MRLFKNEFMGAIPKKTWRSIVQRITRWGLRLMFALYDPGQAMLLMNKVAHAEMEKYNARLIYGVFLGLYKRGGCQMMTVAKQGGNDKENVEFTKGLLRDAIDVLDGKKIRVKGVL